METAKSIGIFLSGGISSSERVCFPIQEGNKSVSYSLSNDLNSATHYCIVDFKERKESVLDLTEIRRIFQDSDGKGFGALGITSMVCGGVSAMALKILTDTGISVFKPINNNILDNLELFTEARLSEYQAQDAKTSSCSSECGSCSSTSCSTN